MITRLTRSIDCPEPGCRHTTQREHNAAIDVFYADNIFRRTCDLLVYFKPRSRCRMGTSAEAEPTSRHRIVKSVNFSLAMPQTYCRSAPFGAPLKPTECVHDLTDLQHSCLPVEIADDTELADLPACPHLPDGEAQLCLLKRNATPCASQSR